MRHALMLLVIPLTLATMPGGIATAGSPCPISLPRGSDPVVLDPADFVPRIDNVNWPMAPGTAGSTGSPTPPGPRRGSS